jgi:hypothetical protein
LDFGILDREAHQEDGAATSLSKVRPPLWWSTTARAMARPPRLPMRSATGYPAVQAA